jgi:hypothetical protein
MEGLLERLREVTIAMDTGAIVIGAVGRCRETRAGITALRYPSQGNMALNFGDRLWIVRKRVLAFGAVFLGAGAVGGVLVWYVSDAKADPGPIVYLFSGRLRDRTRHVSNARVFLEPLDQAVRSRELSGMWNLYLANDDTSAPSGHDSALPALLEALGGAAGRRIAPPLQRTAAAVYFPFG